MLANINTVSKEELEELVTKANARLAIINKTPKLISMAQVNLDVFALFWEQMKLYIKKNNYDESYYKLEETFPVLPSCSSIDKSNITVNFDPILTESTITYMNIVKRYFLLSSEFSDYLVIWSKLISLLESDLKKPKCYITEEFIAEVEQLQKARTNIINAGGPFAESVQYLVLNGSLQEYIFSAKGYLYENNVQPKNPSPKVKFTKLAEKDTLVWLEKWISNIKSNNILNSQEDLISKLVKLSMCIKGELYSVMQKNVVLGKVDITKELDNIQANIKNMSEKDIKAKLLDCANNISK